MNLSIAQNHWSKRAFTLIELLVVIAIIGLLAGIALPNLRTFKPSVSAAATRQLLDAIARGRQLAISHRTTVYMAFVPTNFWNDPNYNVNWTPADRDQAQKLLDKQYVAYNFISLRSMGDQPGNYTVRYLGPWRALPEGAFIAPMKFRARFPVNHFWITNWTTGATFDVQDMFWTNNIPFPRESTAPAQNGTYVWMPYLAFNYLGQLVDGRNQPLGVNEVLPVVLGSVGVARDPNTKLALASSPRFNEQPPGNSTNAFNLVNIDWLTGRARVERQEVR